MAAGQNAASFASTGRGSEASGYPLSPRLLVVPRVCAASAGAVSGNQMDWCDFTCSFAAERSLLSLRFYPGTQPARETIHLASVVGCGNSQNPEVAASPMLSENPRGGVCRVAAWPTR